MRHVRILALPIGWLHLEVLVPDMVLVTENTTCKAFMTGGIVLAVFRIEEFAVLIKWLLVIIHKEEDTSGEEVGGGCLEKLIGTTA